MKRCSDESSCRLRIVESSSKCLSLQMAIKYHDKPECGFCGRPAMRHEAAVMDFAVSISGLSLLGSSGLRLLRLSRRLRAWMRFHTTNWRD